MRNDAGQAYLAHTGRVGSGKVGVSRTNFVAFHGLDKRDVIDYGAEGDLAILLGRVDDKSLVDRISAYVNEVSRFKSGTERQLKRELDRRYVVDWDDRCYWYGHDRCRH